MQGVALAAEIARRVLEAWNERRETARKAAQLARDGHQPAPSAADVWNQAQRRVEKDSQVFFCAFCDGRVRSDYTMPARYEISHLILFPTFTALIH